MNMVRGDSRDRRSIGAWRIAVLPALAAALVVGTVAADPDSDATPEPAAATVSSIGLLPVHAVIVDLDALPGGKGKKDELPALQQLWDSFLKGAGFNTLVFDVDVHDLGDGGAGRVARLCGWAKQNNVRLAPTLVGSAEGKSLPDDYGKLAASFVGKVIANLGAGGVGDYAQIVFYELDRPLNQPANHGAMDAPAAGAILKSAADDLRAAEQAGLSASGMQATPLLVSASFDYELVRRDAAAGAPITDESYEGAYEGLRDYLLDVFGAAPVEAVAVQWFPGSVSADGVDRLPDLVSRLEADLPGKLILMTTGFSSAAGSDTAQARYYKIALNNLCDLRATQGVDSPFAGIVWRSAIDGSGAGGARPSGPPPANEIAKALGDPKADAREARTWLQSVQSHFGLLARARDTGSGVAPKTAYRVMSGLESALSQSPQAADALAAVKELGEAGKEGGLGKAVKSRLQTAMFGLLDAWLTNTADNLFSSPSEEAPFVAAGQPLLPDIQVVDPGAIPNDLTVGVPVRITMTLFNAGTANATDATVYLRDGKRTDLARGNPIMLQPSGQTTVELVWMPTTASEVHDITAEVFCTNDADPSTNSAPYGDRKVAPAKGGGTKPPRPSFNSEAVKSGELTKADARPGGTSGGTSGGASGGTTGGGRSTSGDGKGSTAVMMATQSAAGFATISGMTAPQVMMAPAPSGGSAGAPGGATRSITGTPSSGTGTAGSGTGTTAAAAAQPFRSEPVTMTVTNPFATPFRQVVATLRVDDAVVSTRPIGSLLPHQRRTVVFGDWSPPRPGTYRVRTDLEGVGPNGAKLSSSANSTVTVTTQGTETRPAQDAPTRPLTATRTMATLTARPSSQTVRGFGGMPREAPGVRGLHASAAGAPAIELSANGIQLQPFPCPEGAPIAATVRLRNFRGAAVAGAHVTVTIDGEALGNVAVDLPASREVIAAGFKPWTAKAGRHEVRATVQAGASRLEAVKPFFALAPGVRGFGRPAGVAGAHTATPATPATGKPGLSPGLKPAFPATRPGAAAVDLHIAATDIRFTPAIPAAGAPLTVSIAVHNAGTAIARDGHVLAVLTAGGVEVARKQFTAVVAAGGVVTLQWPLTTPSATPLVVTATATATGDVNPANNAGHATAALKVPTKKTVTVPRATIGK